MKKVIIAVPYLSGKGGTETVIKNFYEALIQNHHEKYFWKLISYGGSKYTSWMNSWSKKIYSFSNYRSIQLLAYMFLLPILIPINLKKEKPDYFVATNPIIWTIAYYSRKFFCPNLKIISWYHYSFKRKHVNKRYLKTADYFWAISNGIKKELISMGITSDKIDVIYNPIPTRNINPISRSGKQNRIVYIGRIDYDGQKNVSELMKALNNVEGNWQCDLYGDVSNDTKEKLLNLVTLPNKERINFHGFFENVWNQIKVADVLVLTSKYEGLGMVLCEAAARGVALISSNCQMGPAEIINSNNGYLYELENYDELSHIVNNIISNKYELPSQKKVEKSVNKFGYNFYKKRILVSLNNRL